MKPADNPDSVKLTLDTVIDEATAMGLLDDEHTSGMAVKPQDAIGKLLADWFNAELFRISEVGGASDWAGLIEDAKARHETFGVPWHNSFVPEYVRDILALDVEENT